MYAFVSLDDSPEPQWQVRVDQIAGIRSFDGCADVLTVGGTILRSHLTVPELMARVQSALGRIDGA